MYIDIGCDTREEVEALGIEVGNMVVLPVKCAHSHRSMYIWAKLWMIVVDVMSLLKR